MFIYKTKKFILNNGSECKLVLPDKKYAEDIYKSNSRRKIKTSKVLTLGNGYEISSGWGTIPWV